jgi:hypothetical protein
MQTAQTFTLNLNFIASPFPPSVVGGLDFFFCVFIWRFNGHLLIILTFVMFVSIQPPRLFFIFSFGPSRHIFSCSVFDDSVCFVSILRKRQKYFPSAMIVSSFVCWWTSSIFFVFQCPPLPFCYSMKENNECKIFDDDKEIISRHVAMWCSLPNHLNPRECLCVCKSAICFNFFLPPSICLFFENTPQQINLKKNKNKRTKKKWRH